MPNREKKVAALVKQLGNKYDTVFNEVSKDGVYSDGFLFLRLIRYPNEGTSRSKQADTLKSLYAMLVTQCNKKKEPIDMVEDFYDNNIPYVIYT